MVPMPGSVIGATPGRMVRGLIDARSLRATSQARKERDTRPVRIVTASRAALRRDSKR